MAKQVICDSLLLKLPDYTFNLSIPVGPDEVVSESATVAGDWVKLQVARQEVQVGRWRPDVTATLPDAQTIHSCGSEGEERRARWFA